MTLAVMLMRRRLACDGDMVSLFWQIEVSCIFLVNVVVVVVDDDDVLGFKQ